MPKPEIHAPSGVREPRAALGMPLHRDARRHAIAEARRADWVAIIAIGIQAVELAREARLDRIVEEAGRDQTGGVVISVFGDGFLAGRVTQHDAHRPRSGGERNVIDIEWAARDRLRESARLIGEDLHGGGHGGAAGKLRQRLCDEVGTELEIAADLKAAHADRSGPVQRAGYDVARGIGDERFRVFIKPP
jgi:hypothetical protein